MVLCSTCITIQPWHIHVSLRLTLHPGIASFLFFSRVGRSSYGQHARSVMCATPEVLKWKVFQSHRKPPVGLCCGNMNQLRKQGLSGAPLLSSSSERCSWLAVWSTGGFHNQEMSHGQRGLIRCSTYFKVVVVQARCVHVWKKIGYGKQKKDAL